MGIKFIIKLRLKILSVLLLVEFSNKLLHIISSPSFGGDKLLAFLYHGIFFSLINI